MVVSKDLVRRTPYIQALFSELVPSRKCTSPPFAPVDSCRHRRTASAASATICIWWLWLRKDKLSKTVPRAFSIMIMSSLSVMFFGKQDAGSRASRRLRRDSTWSCEKLCFNTVIHLPSSPHRFSDLSEGRGVGAVGGRDAGSSAEVGVGSL